MRLGYSREMPSRKSRLFVFAAVTSIFTAVGLNAPPVQAASTTTLTITESSGSIHLGGFAGGGNTVSAVMSLPGSTEIQPYTYGRFAPIWNLSNPLLKTITEYSVLTYKCMSITDANALAVTPTKCGAPASQTTRRASSADPWRRTTGWTFLESIGSDALHKKWIRGRLYIKFSDGTSVQSWTKSRYYISDAPRVAYPTPSTAGTEPNSVPQNSAITMTFGTWEGLNNWTSASPILNRRTWIFQCSRYPNLNSQQYFESGWFPDGCILVASRGIESYASQLVQMNVTTGVAGTYVYVADTLTFGMFPNDSQRIFLQKRTLFSVYDPSTQQSGTSTTIAPVDTTPPTPLQAAGIDTATAPVVSTSGVGTFNGVTAVIRAQKKYARGDQRRSMSVTFSPKSKANGNAVIALVSRVNGEQKIHLVTKKKVTNGKVTWRWRFLKKYPRKKYRIYVQFTPDDSSIAPVTLTKRVDLIG